MNLDIERNDAGDKCIVHLMETMEGGERAVMTVEVDAEWVESHNPAEIQSALRAMGRELYDNDVAEVFAGP